MISVVVRCARDRSSRLRNMRVSNVATFLRDWQADQGVYIERYDFTCVICLCSSIPFRPAGVTIENRRLSISASAARASLQLLAAARVDQAAQPGVGGEVLRKAGRGGATGVEVRSGESSISHWCQCGRARTDSNLDTVKPRD